MTLGQASDDLHAFNRPALKHALGCLEGSQLVECPAEHWGMAVMGNIVVYVLIKFGRTMWSGSANKTIHLYTQGSLQRDGKRMSVESRADKAS